LAIREKQEHPLIPRRKIESKNGGFNAIDKEFLVLIRRPELHRPMEDLDEYEEDGYEEYEDIGEDGYDYEGGGEEEGGEAEEYEDPEIAKQREEYLALRQRLKEKLRKQMKKENGSAHSNSQASRKKLPYDNYGSFFGPSQPVIAQRVIQESKSILETQHLQSRVSNSGHSKKSSTAAGQKPVARESSSKVVNNTLKTKVQKARDTRDYSFLLSDNAELPAPTKALPPRSVSVPKSDARPIQLLNKSKQSVGTTGRQVSTVREERASAPSKPQLQPRVASERRVSASRPPSTSMDSRKSLGSNNGYGPGRPVGSKGPPAKMPPKMPVNMAERNNSAVVAKNSVAVKNVMPGVGMQRPVPLKVQPHIQKQHLDQRRQLPEQNRSKVIPKQTVPSSKPTMKPPKQIPSRTTLQQRPCERPRERPPAKRPAKHYSDNEDDDDGGKAISMIRQMFRYNPKKYVDDDDDSDMEANFADIQREELRSAKIAREEDERELRLIEEEERRERMRREAKQRFRLLKVSPF
ncbi:Chromatin SPT2, partial [Dillenia turbinata]